jgi:hypothetical protein
MIRVQRAPSECGMNARELEMQALPAMLRAAGGAYRRLGRGCGRGQVRSRATTRLDLCWRLLR